MIPSFVIALTLFLVIGTLVMAGTNYTRTGKESYRTISCNGCGKGLSRSYKGEYCDRCGTALTEAQKQWQKYQGSRYQKALNRFMLILIPFFVVWGYCALHLESWLPVWHNEATIGPYTLIVLGFLAPLFLICMELAWWWVDQNKPYRDSAHFQE